MNTNNTPSTTPQCGLNTNQIRREESETPHAPSGGYRPHNPARANSPGNSTIHTSEVGALNDEAPARRSG